MAYWVGTPFADVKDFWPTSEDDKAYALGGNDKVLGYKGNDFLDGGAGNDTLYGESENDALIGGPGVDQLYGGTGTDYFDFYVGDTGSVYAGKADTIHDFQDITDEIWLNGYYSYAGNTSAPGNGQYSVWQKAGNWVVTYNSYSDDGYHDIVVKGGNPYGDISFR